MTCSVYYATTAAAAQESGISLILLLVGFLLELLLHEQPLFEFSFEGVFVCLHPNLVGNRVPYLRIPAREMLHVDSIFSSLGRDEAVFAVASAGVVVVNLLSPCVLLIVHRAVRFVCVDVRVHLCACA